MSDTNATSTTTSSHEEQKSDVEEEHGERKEPDVVPEKEGATTDILAQFKENRTRNNRKTKPKHRHARLVFIHFHDARSVLYDEFEETSSIITGRRPFVEDPKVHGWVNEKAKTFGGFSVQEPVWAQIETFPVWPATIFDPEEAPENVKHERNNEEILVHFFGSKDYAWVNSEQLTRFEDLYVAQNKYPGWDKALQEALEFCGLSRQQWEAGSKKKGKSSKSGSSASTSTTTSSVPKKKTESSSKNTHHTSNTKSGKPVSTTQSTSSAASDASARKRNPTDSVNAAPAPHVPKRRRIAAGGETKTDESQQSKPQEVGDTEPQSPSPKKSKVDVGDSDAHPQTESHTETNSLSTQVDGDDEQKQQEKDNHRHSHKQKHGSSKKESKHSSTGKHKHDHKHKHRSSHHKSSGQDQKKHKHTKSSHGTGETGTETTNTTEEPTADDTAEASTEQHANVELSATSSANPPSNHEEEGHDQVPTDGQPEKSDANKSEHENENTLNSKPLSPETDSKSPEQLKQQEKTTIPPAKAGTKTQSEIPPAPKLSTPSGTKTPNPKAEAKLPSSVKPSVPKSPPRSTKSVAQAQTLGATVKKPVPPKAQPQNTKAPASTKPGPPSIPKQATTGKQVSLIRQCRGEAGEGGNAIFFAAAGSSTLEDVADTKQCCSFVGGRHSRTKCLELQLMFKNIAEEHTSAKARHDHQVARTLVRIVGHIPRRTLKRHNLCISSHSFQRRENNTEVANPGRPKRETPLVSQTRPLLIEFLNSHSQEAGNRTVAHRDDHHHVMHHPDGSKQTETARILDDSKISLVREFIEKQKGMFNNNTATTRGQQHLSVTTLLNMIPQNTKAPASTKPGAPSIPKQATTGKQSITGTAARGSKPPPTTRTPQATPTPKPAPPQSTPEKPSGPTLFATRKTPKRAPPSTAPTPKATQTPAQKSTSSDTPKEPPPKDLTKAPTTPADPKPTPLPPVPKIPSATSKSASLSPKSKAESTDVEMKTSAPDKSATTASFSPIHSTSSPPSSQLYYYYKQHPTISTEVTTPAAVPLSTECTSVSTPEKSHINSVPGETPPSEKKQEQTAHLPSVSLIAVKIDTRYTEYFRTLEEVVGSSSSRAASALSGLGFCHSSTALFFLFLNSNRKRLQ
ncbi:hypothetical protein Pelo_2968 [Pelomyxa schiedti]|nr:hypothetical protein Pelo_2968 [Pelomyxa schiedti]